LIGKAVIAVIDHYVVKWANCEHDRDELRVGIDNCVRGQLEIIFTMEVETGSLGKVRPLCFNSNNEIQYFWFLRLME